MKIGNTLLLGALAGAGAAWGLRAALAARRRIDLDGRVVVLTGASSGHGLIAARLAAERGARLVLAARDAEALNAAANDLAQHHGARDVTTVPTDVTDPAQCERLAARTIARYGRIDVLVNNAGIIQVGPAQAMTLDDYQDAMNTNFWGALHTTIAVLPHMRREGFGRIANVVSVGGLSAVPHLAPYTASKFALTGLTRALRGELAPEGILVTGVYPGTMRTGGHTHAWFKGDREAEYTWFALGDSLPLASVSAEHVAEALWRGVCDGTPEVRVGWQTHLAGLVEPLMPNLTAEARALVALAMPKGTGAEGEADPVQGQELTGRMPELLTKVVPPPARPQPGGA